MQKRNLSTYVVYIKKYVIAPFEEARRGFLLIESRVPLMDKLRSFFPTVFRYSLRDEKYTYNRINSQETYFKKHRVERDKLAEMVLPSF